MADNQAVARRELARREMARRELERRRKDENSYSGAILPFTRDEDGVRFDSDAGIIGSIKRAVTLPGEVMRGEVDPMSEEGHSRAMEMAGVVSPASAALRAGERIIPGVAKATQQARKPHIPTARELHQAADEGYAAFRGTPVEYSADKFASAMQTLRQKLNNDGFDEINAPDTFKFLRQFDEVPEGAIVTPNNLQSAYSSAGKIGQKNLASNPADSAASNSIRKGIDEFIGVGDEAGSVVGPPTAQGAAAKIYKDARGNYAAAKRTDAIDNLEWISELRGAAANSGQNVGNATRQRIASHLNKAKDVRGYSPEELAALEKVVRGTTAENITRSAGNVLGGGGGLGSMVTGGAGAMPGIMASDPMLAAAGAIGAPMAGKALKAASTNMSKRGLQSVNEMLRKRSPMYEALKEAAPMEVIAPEKRAALIRALLLSGQNQQ